MAKIDEKINFRYNIREYWTFLKEDKPLFFGLLFLSLVLSILFVADKYLFKIIIDDGGEFIAGNLASSVFVETLIILALVFVAIVLVRTLGTWLRFHLAVRLDAKLISDLKKRYFNHIIKLSHNFHTTHKTGSLISRLTRGTGAIENMTDILIFQFTPLIFNLIVVIISLVYFSWVPALVITLSTIVFILYSYMIQRFQEKYKLLQNQKQDIEKGFIGDIFTNIDSIKYFGKEIDVKRRFAKFVKATKSSEIKHGGYYRWFEGGQTLILSISTLLLLYFPLVQLLNNEITLGTLVFIYTIYGNVIGPMFGFVWGMRGFYKSMADFQYLFEYGKIENEIKDKPNAEKLDIKEGIIEFKNINFDYGKRKMFRNFNLKIKKGEKVALVGRSGCGKTTLVKLLYRFYDVNSGKILIDSKNIREFRQESLRSEMGVVPQECILFDDTVYNNIKFANPKASRKDVMKAIRFAQLDKVIKGFPKKENTIVGERGIKLSGGEKQRVSIARAVLANKKVLVLDEATSSLDSETEHDIQKSLQKLLKDRTSMIIAHRLSTIMKADRIIVMKKGKIVQEGKHSELISQGGEYKKLWDLQKGGYIS